MPRTNPNWSKRIFWFTKCPFGQCKGPDACFRLVPAAASSHGKTNTCTTGCLKVRYVYPAYNYQGNTTVPHNREKSGGQCTLFAVLAMFDFLLTIEILDMKFLINRTRGSGQNPTLVRLQNGNCFFLAFLTNRKTQTAITITRSKILFFGSL